MKGQKRKRPSTGVRKTTVVLLSLDAESENMSAESSKERQPPQPLEFYFKSTKYTETCKIQTKCKVTKTVDVIKKLKDKVKLFTSHTQCCMVAVNGVPIRYSMREHALISGLDCHEYPRRHLKLGGTKFKPCNDRLKMAVLFLLGQVIIGKTKDYGPVYPFILRIVEDLDVCRTLPWGRLTFEDAIKEIRHMMEFLKGEVYQACGFPGFIIPVMVKVLGFVFGVTVSNLPLMVALKLFYTQPLIYVELLAFIFIGLVLLLKNPCEDCPRMCKSRFTKSSMKGYPLEDIYAALGKTKVINSVLVSTVSEERLMARIIDVESEYDSHGSTSDTWNFWLNVKQKTIWWKELYELDVNARVFTKKKDKEKVMSIKASSSNSGIDLSLKSLEDRILKSMGEGFDRLNKFCGGKAGDDSKDDGIDYGKKTDEDKENSEMAEAGKDKEKEEENVEEEEQEPESSEKRRVEAEKENNQNSEENSQNLDAAWRRILSESDDEKKTGKEAEKLEEEDEKEPKGTPTPPRGRTKASDARRQSYTTPYKCITPPEKKDEETAVEAEKK
ncbi:hypothetical protein N665_0067s0008 [Sinapis alba]|nr:hypothetical protein N665_0067s0008 [Sinapis alba]